MIRAKFDNGPLSGQLKELPFEAPPFYIYGNEAGEFTTEPMNITGKTRYYLSIVDKKGIAHYCESNYAGARRR